MNERVWRAFDPLWNGMAQLACKPVFEVNPSIYLGTVFNILASTEVGPGAGGDGVAK